MFYNFFQNIPNEYKRHNIMAILIFPEYNKRNYEKLNYN